MDKEKIKNKFEEIEEGSIVITIKRNNKYHPISVSKEYHGAINAILTSISSEVPFKINEEIYLLPYIEEK